VRYIIWIAQPADSERAMQKRNYTICQSCGKNLEYTDCSDRRAPPEDARCKVLSGWLSVSHWQGMEAVNHYDFCSFTCLQRWVESQIPKVPEVFLKALEGE